MRKFAAIAGALLSAGALAVSLSTVMAGSAQASVTPDPAWNEIWAPYLTARSNTVCVDDPGGSLAIGVHLQLFHCHGYGSDGAPQRWYFHDLGSTSAPQYSHIYWIEDTHSGLCLSAMTPGGAVTEENTCGNHSSAIWMLRSENLWSTDPNFLLVLWSSTFGGDGTTGYCLAAGNSTDSNHTPLVTVPCNTGPGGFQNGLAVWRLG